MRPTVLIVDDHEDLRRSARPMLEAEGFDIVGEAADGESALARLALLKPDIVLLDIHLPDLDGFAVAGRMAAGVDPPIVVLMSSRDADSYGRRLNESGAHGFIAKSALSGATLTTALRVRS